MKKISVLVLCGCILLGCGGVRGSGNIVKESRKLNSFTGLSVSQSIEVIVRMGNSQEVQIAADDNIIGNIETEVNDGVLEIRFSNNFSVSNSHVEVEIEVPYLDYIKVSSSAVVTIKDKMRYDGNLRILASSSGEVKADVYAKEITAEVGSSSSVELKGNAGLCDFSASSSGEIDAMDLECDTATAAASSSGVIKINVRNNLDASASSSGVISYKGTAVVVKSIGSSGSVEKK